nr:MAG TPA: hypothetical protein [Caudoviricetes sp.]
MSLALEWVSVRPVRVRARERACSQGGCGSY